VVGLVDGYRRPLTVRFEGPAIRVPDFVSMLDGAGYFVECSPAVYQRAGESEPDDMATAVLFVSGTGSGKTVGALADELIQRSGQVPISISVV
jgi:hypothetical protein